jgi:hypothetical protein
MASPFTVFRRYQKVLLAVTGILAMIAFVFIGPTCLQSSRSLGQGQNPAVVSWKFGTIHEGEMFSRMKMRRDLNQFLIQARLLAGQPLSENYQRFDVSEQGVVNGMVLSQLGKDLGLIISDDIVNMRLAEWTGNRVRPGDLEQIIARLTQQRVSSQQIFEALRQEFLAEYAYQLWLAGAGVDPLLIRDDFSLDPPEQRWENFLRLEQSIVAQVMPVPVAEFIDEVAEPTDAELREFYNRYKNQEPIPGSPEPGFRQPYRAKFEYFKADMESMVASVMPQITDREISEYYEKNKDTLFRAASLPDLDEKKNDAAKQDESSDEKKGDSATEKDKEEKADSKENRAADKADDRGGSKGEDSTKQDAETNNEKSVEPDDKSGADKSKGSATTKTGTRKRESPYHFVSFQNDKGDASASPKKKGESAVPAVDEKKSDDNEAETANKDSAAKQDTAKDATDGESTKGEKADATNTENTKSEPVEYKPLDKVRDDIRRSLARQRVPERVQDKFDKLRGIMTEYGRARNNWLIEKSSDPNLPAPRPLNFETLAQDYRVKSFSTELLSRVDAATAKDLDIAKSFDRMPWTSVAFEPGGLYRPSVTMDIQGNRYLWWKIDEREARLPDFDEIRKEVLEAYKMFHARDKAVAQAREYAKQVKAASKNMKDLFADDKDLPVTQTEPFTWLTSGNVPGMGQLRMSEVKGVEMAGEDFMETAYSLAPGETGVALNAPKTVAYVIQVIETAPSRAVLQKEFMARIQNYNRFRVAGSNELADARRWMDSLYEKYGVHWERPAQQPRMAMQ